MPDEKLTPAQEEAKRLWPLDQLLGADHVATQLKRRMGFVLGAEWQENKDATYIKQLEEALFGLNSWANRAYSQLYGEKAEPRVSHPILRANEALKKYKGSL